MSIDKQASAYNGRRVGELRDQLAAEKAKVKELVEALRRLHVHADHACSMTSVEYGKTDWFQVAVDVAYEMIEKYKEEPNA